VRRRIRYAEIGYCHRWISPHQTPWSADGGFAWPFGYNKTVTGFSYIDFREREGHSVKLRC
jgi:hypothetical protein